MKGYKEFINEDITKLMTPNVGHPHYNEIKKLYDCDFNIDIEKKDSRHIFKVETHIIEDYEEGDICTGNNLFIIEYNYVDNDWSVEIFNVNNVTINHMSYDTMDDIISDIIKLSYSNLGDEISIAKKAIDIKNKEILEIEKHLSNIEKYKKLI